MVVGRGRGGLRRPGLVAGRADAGRGALARVPVGTSNVFFIAERRWQALTRSAAIESAPRFTRDGRAVLYSADYGGVYNIRRLDLETGRIETLTNVSGGAFSPDAAADGRLYYIGYTPPGFDLFRLAAPKALPTPTPPAGPSAVIAADDSFAPDPAWRSGPYCTLCGLRPRWWFPRLVVEEGRTEIGASTSGTDALVRHLYAVDAAYDFSNDSPVGGLVYLCDGSGTRCCGCRPNARTALRVTAIRTRSCACVTKTATASSLSNPGCAGGMA